VYIDICIHVVCTEQVDGSTLFNVPDVLEPRAISFDSASATLFVADTHPSRENIRIYEANGSFVGSFGAAGGVYAPGVPAGHMCVSRPRRKRTMPGSRSLLMQSQLSSYSMSCGWQGAQALYGRSWRWRRR
jgi:hypothetical protein